jgi:hypothetical protein
MGWMSLSTRKKVEIEDESKSAKLSPGDVQLRDKHAQLIDEQIEIRQLIACA